MTARLVALAACGLIALAGCSKKQAEEPSAPATPAAPAAAKMAEAPPEEINLAAADMGGAVEELTGNYGPGFTGRRLVDGLLAPTWSVQEVTNPPPPQPFYPQETVISFFERHAAEVHAIDIILPDDPAAAPKDIEIWTSMTNPYENFSRVAVATLEKKPGVQTVELDDPVEAKYVKLKVLSGHSPGALEIAEVRVLEADRRGYIPLFARAPMVKHWKGSPREGAQRGLDWLQHAAPTWKNKNGLCFGCHVQSQVLMGQAVALKHQYRVNRRSVEELDNQIRSQASYGSFFGGSHSAVIFGAMGLTYAAEAMGVTSDKGRWQGYPQYSELEETAKRVFERQAKDGSLPVDEVNPPIVQGQFMTTANSLVTISWAAAQSDDDKYDRFIERATGWIASNEPETTQDKIFKVIALMHYGTPDQKRIAWSVVEVLAAEQQADGGWKENAASDGSNAIATGQVLYAFKQAGISIHGEMFRRGVDFLLGHQEKDPKSLENGSWIAMNTASEKPSGFAHTMWAVIGLAGAYGAEPTGALQIIKQQGDKPPSPNLEIVLDVSGSMNAKLGDSTRWKTALAMLGDVVAALPEDMNVGLRVYGHRQSSKSAQTCKDTELVVPIAKLDRERLVKAATRLKPRGETPLIHSILQTVGDLKTAGGGSVILITDGEESCKGDAKAAAAELQASGLNLTLNIVGFTLTSENAVAELTALAGSTGGRYYSAQDGEQLSRAVKLAALHRLPYDILDKTGKVLVSGQTSELSRELPPGEYRIKVDALGQVLEDSLTIVANETTSIGLGVEGDRFVLRR
jgi:hypothetical protein